MFRRLLRETPRLHTTDTLGSWAKVQVILETYVRAREVVWFVVEHDATTDLCYGLRGDPYTGELIWCYFPASLGLQARIKRCSARAADVFRQYQAA